MPLGRANQVLPEPVPVVTSVLRGDNELRRRKAFSWWRLGGKGRDTET